MGLNHSTEHKLLQDLPSKSFLIGLNIFSIKHYYEQVNSNNAS